ncbi:hypothetical protein M0R45_016106 [Rubus argutus]|uniref:Uncharacterized protein n=1 Tax=Rubus argutus TaxID=59490 RepID=A0AAW1XRL9_RUBAR
MPPSKTTSISLSPPIHKSPCSLSVPKPYRHRGNPSHAGRDFPVTSSSQLTAQPSLPPSPYLTGHPNRRSIPPVSSGQTTPSAHLNVAVDDLEPSWIRSSQATDHPIHDVNTPARNLLPSHMPCLCRIVFFRRPSLAGVAKRKERRI